MAAPRAERSRESLPSLMAAARGTGSFGDDLGAGGAGRGGETLAAAGGRGALGLRGEGGDGGGGDKKRVGD